jgi:FkbM family methyltransferase
MASPNIVVTSSYGPIIVNVNDKFITKSIISNGGWAEHEIELIAQLVSYKLNLMKHIMIYDIGANIGTHTLALSKIFGDKVSIKAYEAQSAIYNMLCGTVALNNLRNVKCYNNAVSNTDHDIEIALPDYMVENNFGGLELIQPSKSDNQTMVKNGMEVVKAITIDSLNEHVDILKIDVEGMEHLVIDGAKNTIDKNRPICFVEIFKTDTDYILEFFRSRDYMIYRWNTNVFTDAVFIPKESGIGVGGLVQVS